MTGKKIRIMIMAAALSALAVGGCGNTGQDGNPASGGSAQDSLAGQPAEESQASAESSESSGGQDEQEAGEAGDFGDGQEAPAEESLPEGYQLVTGDAVLVPEMDIRDALLKLPEAKSMYEAPSCAGQGVSYFYDYSAFEIETYPAADGADRIGYIILKDDTVATSEGIDLSMTREDCIGAYGDGYEEGENKITYIKGNMKLNFIFEGENIVSIEYASAVIG